MQLFELLVLTWLVVLTMGLFYVIFEIGQMLAMIEKISGFNAVSVKNIDLLITITNRLTDDLKVISKFTHTHEGKPYYTFNVKDIN